MAKKTILFATSDEDTKERVFDALNEITEFSITWVCDSGDLLLRILESDIDLAIIDTRLTGISIEKSIEIIKKSRPKVPLIVISSWNSMDHLAKVLEQGVFYFLLRPISRYELKESVESALK